MGCCCFKTTVGYIFTVDIFAICQYTIKAGSLETRIGPIQTTWNFDIDCDNIYEYSIPSFNI